MHDADGRDRALRLIQAAGVAEAAGESLDLPALAAELGVSEPTLRMDLDQVQGAGLVLLPEAPDAEPLLLTTGRQYLARKGEVAHEVLWFLPHVIDDLNTREALLHAGAIVVDEFRAALLDGQGIAHAAELVPAAFGHAVDSRLALDLYAAAVALMARLSDGSPAGCVAEEIVAVALLDEARALIELSEDGGDLTPQEVKDAAGELMGVFELFEDDDVLELFDMAEPADAALAGHDPVNRQLGVVDQRVEAWFRPFGGVAPTGYLADDPDDDVEDED